MSFTKSKFKHPRLKINDLGLTYREYEGAVSTLCAGCGHDAITSALVQACFELSISPQQIVKMSGIGCSSKAPNYFMNNAHGFNSVHGRMPSVTTGANLANHELIYLGMSGDGDSASIGLGQFAHVVRRELNMVYIVANNGVYGLTKGQLAATSDKGAKNKNGEQNLFSDIDLCTMALQLGAGFVARTFSGDRNQLIPLLKAAINHQGFAFIDIISPCVTFNNHDDSSRSYHYMQEHTIASVVADFIPEKNTIVCEVAPGDSQDIKLHDGSLLRLHHKDDSVVINNRLQAITAIEEHKAKGEILTGLLYLDAKATDFHHLNNTSTKPLNQLTQEQLCPGRKQLAVLNDEFR